MPAATPPEPGEARVEPIPGFKEPTSRFARRENEGEAPSPPASTAPPTTSTRSSSPPPDSSPPPPATTSSSPASSDDRQPVVFDVETAEALAGMATGAALALGAALNKLADRRKPTKTDRWKMAEDEAEALGTAAAGLTTRRLPDAVTEGDGPELLQIAAVLIGYGVRNLLNVSPAEAARAAAGPAPVPVASWPAPPGPPQQPAGAWPTAPEPRYQAPPPPPPPPAPPAPVPATGFDGVEAAATQASDVVALLQGADL